MNRIEQISAMLADSPDDPFLMYALAKEYESAGDIETALAQYLRLKAVHPDYVGLYYHLGKLYEKKDRPDQAIEIYREGKAAASNANDRHALSEISGALMEISDDDDDF